MYVPYVNRPPLLTTFDDGDHELHPRPRPTMAATAAMVRQFCFTTCILLERSRSYSRKVGKKRTGTNSILYLFAATATTAITSPSTSDVDGDAVAFNGS